MGRTGIAASRYSDAEIAQMFSDYVSRMEDKPRHTKAAANETEQFDTYIESEFPMNIRVQNGLFDRMMDVAVEYEESGFIAGFKTAMALVTGNDGLLPAPLALQETSGMSQEQPLNPGTNNSTPKAEKGQDGAINEPQEEEKYIDTMQLAKMFRRKNWKMVYTINTCIMPYLNDEERKGFILSTKMNIKAKHVEIYKLTLNGCRKFLELCEGRHSDYSNFVSGAKLLREEMERVWHNGCHAALA